MIVLGEVGGRKKRRRMRVMGMKSIKLGYVGL